MRQYKITPKESKGKNVSLFNFKIGKGSVKQEKREEKSHGEKRKLVTLEDETHKQNVNI